MIQCLECSFKFNIPYSERFEVRSKKCPNCKRRLNHFSFCDSDKNDEKTMIFSLNELIDLRYEDGRTKIYINNQYFSMCMALILRIPVSKAEDRSFMNIDDYEDYKTNHSEIVKLDPITEFWGHCSNMEAWVENDYNSSILRYNLSFPLLKKLCEEGDIVAERVFKEEVAIRLKSSHDNVILFLIKGNYLDFYSIDEIKTIIFDNLNQHLIRQYIHTFSEEELHELFEKTKSKTVLMYLAYEGYVNDEDVFFKLFKQLSEEDISSLIYSDKILKYVNRFKHQNQEVIFINPRRLKVKGEVDLIDTGMGFLIKTTEKTRKVQIDFDEVRTKKISIGNYIGIVHKGFDEKNLKETDKGIILNNPEVTPEVTYLKEKIKRFNDTLNKMKSKLKSF
jgi:hypothetical protein